MSVKPETIPTLKEIIFWGASGHALVLHDFIGNAGYRLVALFDRNADLQSPLTGITVYPGAEFQSWISNHGRKTAFALAIGGSDGADRMKLFSILSKAGLEAPVLIHPQASVSKGSHLGAGSQVLAGACLVTHAQLGKACILNTRSSVDHECILGDGVHIAPGATLAGCVEVGEHSFIGTGSVVLPRIKIGKNVIIGAGSLVTKDIPDHVVAYGHPAKIIRQNYSN